jgi:2-succinyl-5-enolpyruvyl-6-hydroxy-3-cyclohexene-1-carboxylate synthase
MKSSSKVAVQILVEQCVAYGMKYVVISPGSRNAPLIIAFDEHPEISCTLIHDERSAAFYALGMAQTLKEPVGILCTSGSAALNFYPAIAEAYYQSIPLVVFTADRPSEWVDQGDGQTIVQKNLYANHVRYSCDFQDSFKHDDHRWFLEREVATAFNLGNGNWKGPVHFNTSFREPLYGVIEIERPLVKKIEMISSVFQLRSSQYKELKSVWEKSTKKMVVVGQMPVDKALLEQLKQLSEDTSVAILVENTSNLVHHRFVHCIDRTLNAITEAELGDFSPDLLITLGGAVVSKRIKSFLRKYKPAFHWKVGYEFPYMDCYQALTHSFECTPYAFVSVLGKFSVERNASSFGSKWKQKDFIVQDRMENYFENVAYSDLKVFETVLDYIPEMSHLHMGNSSVVRYCQLFDPVASITCWSNRGTSGIDGSASTACGAAAILKADWHTLITGDISFFYDSNAFWNSNLTPNLRIYMINNGGGGIFKILPGPKETRQLNEFFVASHDFSAEHICKAFHIDYFKAESIREIESQMESFYTYEENGSPKLMEIFTPSENNHEVLNNFFSKMSLESVQ